MKKLRLAAAVAVAAAVTLLVPGAAQAYPDGPNVIITIPDATLIGGNTVSFTATTDTEGLECDWTVTLANGVGEGVDETLTDSGTSISGSYVTKVVSDVEKHPLTATCTYDDTDLAASASISGSTTVTPAFYAADSGSTIQAASQDASASATVTLLPRGGDNDSDDNGILPDTGGSSMWFLVIGGALLVGGGGVLYAARRRQQPSH